MRNNWNSVIGQIEQKGHYFLTFHTLGLKYLWTCFSISNTEISYIFITYSLFFGKLVVKFSKAEGYQIRYSFCKNHHPQEIIEFCVKKQFNKHKAES